MNLIVKDMHVGYEQCVERKASCLSSGFNPPDDSILHLCNLHFHQAKRPFL